MPALLPRRVEEPGIGTLEIWALDISEEFLRRVFEDIFLKHWHEIEYGILLQGGVLEITPLCAPTKCGIWDGYLTLEFGDTQHVHVCIGKTTGKGCTPTPPAVAAVRPPSRVEMFRKLNSHGQPTFWALRVLNSEPVPVQTFIVYLPNPLLTGLSGEFAYANPPDWSKLELWDYLRETYLGIIEPDPLDRTARRFSHD
jgi:hypothetical protein